jgi:hypothetical protein
MKTQMAKIIGLTLVPFHYFNWVGNGHLRLLRVNTHRSEAPPKETAEAVEEPRPRHTPN